MNQKENIEMEMMNKYKGKVGKIYKSFSIDTKDLSINSESRTISGYAAIWGNIDKAQDMLIRGCCSKSIAERGPESSANDKIIFLWMHDMSEPIARITKLIEDEKGLYFEAIVDEIELGDRAIKQLESGTLNQFSIGYSYVFENCVWDDVRKCLVVKEIILYEISVVSIGCNGETEYLGLKTAEEANDKYEELLKEMAIVCKNMSSSKQQKIQRIIAKAMTLASFKPIEESKEEIKSLVSEQAGTLGDNNYGFKLKKN